MKIAIVGSGNIATFFSKKLFASGHTICQVISAHLSHADELAKNYSAPSATDIQSLDTSADVILFAVRDDLLAQLISRIPTHDAIVVHTAGSVQLDDLSHLTPHLGCIWSMYSVNKNHLPERTDIPLIVNATDDKAWAAVQSLAECISNSVYKLTDQQKLRAHLAAVFANNFANFMFTIGQNILKEDHIPFDLLIPLIENTVEKLHYSPPDKLQTGPAIRHDERSLIKHQQLLVQNDDWLSIYNMLTTMIQKMYPKP